MMFIFNLSSKHIQRSYLYIRIKGTAATKWKLTCDSQSETIIKKTKLRLFDEKKD